ncbi:hypothetical protein [Bacillus thuringiensis]|uniref:hypothetical protein n=1 Tax=Bacillus thuringiensis TaxID=1428 RepID=UPI0021D68CC8|nr:hypothetical protein [Bacillus thuringiensis]MCU7666748.1 hypothetical protein [Bacillus thuringiensis]
MNTEKENLMHSQELRIMDDTRDIMSILKWIEQDVSRGDYKGASLKMASLNEKITDAVAADSFIKGLQSTINDK